MTPNCNGKSYSRDLCKRCYQVAYYKVQRKLTTWLRLETKGLCSQSRRVRQNHFEEAYERAANEVA